MSNKNTAKKTAQTTEKTPKTAKTKVAKQAEPMSYGQVKALSAALFHSGKTKAQLCTAIDKLLEQLEAKPAKNAMKPEAKAKWLEEHGNEPCTWGQCMMYAMTLFNAKQPKAKVSEIIKMLDEESGYKPTTETATTETKAQA